VERADFLLVFHPGRVFRHPSDRSQIFGTEHRRSDKCEQRHRLSRSEYPRARYGSAPVDGAASSGSSPEALRLAHFCFGMQAHSAHPNASRRGHGVGLQASCGDPSYGSGSLGVRHSALDTSEYSWAMPRTPVEHRRTFAPPTSPQLAARLPIPEPWVGTEQRAPKDRNHEGQHDSHPPSHLTPQCLWDPAGARSRVGQSQRQLNPGDDSYPNRPDGNRENGQ
jgi:hypothetical protein